MEIEYYYNNALVKLDLPANIKIDTFSPVSAERPFLHGDFLEHFSQSGCDKFLEEGNILFVVNDAHRNTPTVQILKWINQTNPDTIEHASFLVACGTHDIPDNAQKQKIFGELLGMMEGRIFYHDCHDTGSLKKIGVDKFGEDVWLNKKLFEYDKVFIISSVEPHYFAGFTGGRKSLFPGLTDFKTIERNHNLANSLDSAPLRLKGNPVAEHMENMKSLVDLTKVRSLQVVYDAEKTISSLHFGELDDAFESAVESATRMYSARVPALYDLVLMEIKPPQDKNLYQAQKALENSQAVVKDEGTAIIVSACNEGIGSSHFYELAADWDKESNRPRGGELFFGSHKLSRVNNISKRINAYICSTLSEGVVSKVFYKSITDINKYIAEDSRNKEGYRLALVHDAAHMVLTN